MEGGPSSPFDSTVISNIVQMSCVKLYVCKSHSQNCLRRNHDHPLPVVIPTSYYLLSVKLASDGPLLGSAINTNCKQFDLEALEVWGMWCLLQYLCYVIMV